MNGKIRVAHFCTFGPNRCGMYHTVRDLILGERAVGLDAQMIAATIDKDKKLIAGEIHSDGDFITVDLEWAKQADILVTHSIIPKEIRKTGKPIITCSHGRPESSFLLGYTNQIKLWAQHIYVNKHPQYKGIITFWPEFVYERQLEFPNKKVYYVPAPVDLKKYSPEGKKFDWGKHKGKINILIADIWRDDVRPYNTIFSCIKFLQEYEPEGKLHIIGLTKVKNGALRKFIQDIKRTGKLGYINGLVKHPEEFYRAADFVVTPHIIDTRIVREARACGCPVIKGYSENPLDVDKFKEKIKKDLQEIESSRNQISKNAANVYDNKKSGQAMKELIEKILAEENSETESIWDGDQFKARKYKDYQEYIKHQKEKLDKGIGFLEQYDKEYCDSLVQRLNEHKFKLYKGETVLCLGARIGTEVKAFIKLGLFAVGIDLNTGKENRYVVTGDFHNLQFADKSIDICFTNSIDHVFDINKFTSEIERVLKLKGLLIIDLEKRTNCGKDKYSSFWWKEQSDLIKYFESQGFKLQEEINEGYRWFEKILIFEKG